MIRNKKAVELPITAIIIFVILIVVAVVLIVIFTSKARTGAEQIGSCALKQGTCSNNIAPNFDTSCPEGYISLGSTPDCKIADTQNRCCLKV